MPDKSLEHSVGDSHLFTLRIWLEDVGGGKTVWRGKVQHVSSGEVRYVHDWPALEGFIERMLHDSGLDAQGRKP